METRWFTFEQDVHPVPATPTHCGCGTLLEPLRRYAGLCKACVAQRSVGKVVKQPTDKLVTRLVVIRMLVRERCDHGQTRRVRYVEVRCCCGRKRMLPWTTWQHHRPLSCNICRMRDIAARGFEAEYAR